MNYCPICGFKLEPKIIDKSQVMQCPSCQYIDWNNWVNVSCVVVAYNNENEFLMVKLKDKEEGKLTFPGGYRDLGETLEEAAKREFFEETGMKLDNLELYTTYTKDEQRLVWVVFKAMIDNFNFIENDEVSEVILIGKNDIINKHLLRGTLTEALFNTLISERE